MKLGREFPFLFLGLLLVIGPFFWRVDVGDRILSATQAWETGTAQIIMAMGALLLVLEVFLWRGALWPRWAIVFWCLFNLITNIGWSIVTGIGEIAPLEIVWSGLIGAFWMGGCWRHFFRPSPVKSD
jgi:hypothetical protein